MALEIFTGNIFTTKCQTIVNTVNCVGVMGTGIALECRLRYPEMYDKYISICNQAKLKTGMLWIYKGEDHWILNFPTKTDWKLPSKKEYLHAGLSKFIETYSERGISSIAFPVLGSSKGGIPEEESLDIMRGYLSDLPILIEIYRYDPTATDDLYCNFKNWLSSQNIKTLSEASGLSTNYAAKILEATKYSEITQINQLASLPGIGIKTLEKIFKLAATNKLANNSKKTNNQMSFFDE